MADPLHNHYRLHDPPYQAMHHLHADFIDPDDDESEDDEEAAMEQYFMDREAARLRHLAPHIRPDMINPTPLQQTWTQEQCVENVFEVFPEVSRKHVSELYTKLSFGFVDGALCQGIIEEIMSDAKYPRERDDRQAELRKTEEHKKAMQEHKYYFKTSQFLLGEAFPNASNDLIKTTLQKEGTVTKAHAVLSAPEVAAARPSKRRKKDGEERDRAIATYPPELIDFVLRELHEAQNGHVTPVQSNAAPKNQTVDLTVEIIECRCCYDDVPSNQTAFCDGAETHSFCLNCVRRVVETEIEYRRSRPSCMSFDPCNGGFAEHQLRLALDSKTMDHLLRLRQQQDLKNSGIEGMTECPFCDYMEPCRPVREDKEFRCKNEDCLRTSCRLCEKDTHLPLTCAQAESDRKLDARHMLEEAMTSALVRRCNVETCKTKFVKSDGCNSMHCPKCQNHQCYVCGENIKSYDHFAKGKCQTHDGPGGLEALHQADVKKAEEAAKVRIRADRPDITEEELQIKVSDAVKQAEARTTAAAAADPMNRLARMHHLLARNREDVARARRIGVPAEPYHALPDHAEGLFRDLDYQVFNPGAQSPQRQAAPPMPDVNTQIQAQQNRLQQLQQRRTMLQARVVQQTQARQTQQQQQRQELERQAQQTQQQQELERHTQDLQRLLAWDKMRQYRQGADDFHRAELQNVQARAAANTRPNELPNPQNVQERLRRFQNEERAQFRAEVRQNAEVAVEELLAPPARPQPQARPLAALNRMGMTGATATRAPAPPAPPAPPMTTAHRRLQEHGNMLNRIPTFTAGLDAPPRPAPQNLDLRANIARQDAEFVAQTREMRARLRLNHLRNLRCAQTQQPQPVEPSRTTIAPQTVRQEAEIAAFRREMHTRLHGVNNLADTQTQQPRTLEAVVDTLQANTAHVDAEHDDLRRGLFRQEQNAVGVQARQLRPTAQVNAVAADFAGHQLNAGNLSRPAERIVDLTASSSDIEGEEDDETPSEDSDDDEVEILSIHEQERVREEIDLTADDEDMEIRADAMEANQLPAEPALNRGHDMPGGETIIDLSDDLDTSDDNTSNEDVNDMENFDPVNYGVPNTGMDVYGPYNMNANPQLANRPFAYNTLPTQQTIDDDPLAAYYPLNFYPTFNQQQAYNVPGNHQAPNQQQANMTLVPNIPEEGNGTDDQCFDDDTIYTMQPFW